MCALRLLLASLDAYVQYVAAAKYHVAVVGGRRVTTVFGCPFKYYVHVAIGVNHSASVLDIVLQSNIDFRVEFLHEQVQRFP